MTCRNCDKPTTGRYCSNLCEDMDRHPAPRDDMERFTHMVDVLPEVAGRYNDHDPLAWMLTGGR